jgi:hypothetical protein
MAKTETNAPEPTPAASSTDAGQAEVQDAFDAANEKGYFGVTTDPTPNENYTLQGAGKGLPTPETDDEQAAKVAAHQRKVARGEVTEG